MVGGNGHSGIFDTVYKYGNGTWTVLARMSQKKRQVTAFAVRKDIFPTTCH